MTIYSYSNPINTSVDAGHPGAIEPERAVEYHMDGDSSRYTLNHNGESVVVQCSV